MFQKTYSFQSCWPLASPCRHVSPSAYNNPKTSNLTSQSFTKIQMRNDSEFLPVTWYLWVQTLAARRQSADACTQSQEILKRFYCSFIIWDTTRDMPLIHSASPELQNACICFRLCPSVCLHVTTREPLKKFSWNLIFDGFTKIFRHISVLVKIW
jgi:hypothetical protein